MIYDVVAAARAEPAQDELIEHLRALIRIPSVSGDEIGAARHVADVLATEGIAAEVLEPEPRRGSVVARLRGDGSGGGPLLLMSHLDVVPASAERWTHDPFGGEVVDGYVWGRGAIDMKHTVAMELQLMLLLARHARAASRDPAGDPVPGLRRDVIFAATADEEVGADYGLSWLCAAHPEAVRATYCVNEGGGDRIVVGGKALYLCASSEKATAPFTLRVRGRSGHASMPSIGDNALVRSAPLLERLGRIETPLSLSPETRAFLTAVLGEVSQPDVALARLRELAPRAASMVEPMLRATISPTQIEASQRRNVIPALCEIGCDWRLLPGQTQAEIEEAIAAALGSDGWELEWLDSVGGSRSSFDTPLRAAIESFIGREEPGALLVPVLLPGFTDSHYLREAFGTIAYGFFPARSMAAELAALLVHSADERVPVDDLELGTRFLAHVARELVS